MIQEVIAFQSLTRQRKPTRFLLNRGSLAKSADDAGVEPRERNVNQLRHSSACNVHGRLESSQMNHEPRTLDSFEDLCAAFSKGECIYAIHRSDPAWSRQSHVVGVTGEKIILRRMSGSYATTFDEPGVRWVKGGFAMD